MNAQNDSQAELIRIVAEQRARQGQNHKLGVPALKRLMDVALRDTGQSSVCGRFLLGLYNGQFYRFDLTELRRLDQALLEDCLTVLRMDAQPSAEIHCLLDGGDDLFHRLRMLWVTRDEVAGLSDDEQQQWHRLRAPENHSC